MEPASDMYEDVARVYIQVIRQDSPEAATAVEEIQIRAGSRAALRATHILTMLKMEIKQNRYMPNLSMYSYILNDYPDALPLLEHAIDCCLEAWGIQNVNISLQHRNAPYHRS